MSLVASVKFKTGSLNIMKTKKLKLLVKHNLSGHSCELPLVHMTFCNKDSNSRQLQHKKMILDLRSARAVPLTPTQLSATKKPPYPTGPMKCGTVTPFSMCWGSDCAVSV